jgi:hypothetical protein
MYDPSGTDTKHEWVEVCNTGSVSTDVSNYKLNESGTNHGLTLTRGSGNLAHQACAVLADDATTFLADYPSFSGNLFDTAFSLSNSGEALILRDSSLADVDGISYSSSQGGAGDGSSLHRSGSTFVGGSASPGSESGLVANTGTPADTTTPTDTTTTTGSNTATSVTTVFHTVTIEPPPRVFLRVPETLRGTAQSVVFFSAETYNAKGNVQSAQVTWVFGDGFSEKGMSVNHVYKKAGEYEVTVTASTTDGLSDEATIIVHIDPNALSFSISEDGKEVTLTNNGETTIDLTGYRIIAGARVFYFPEKTRVMAGKSITLLSEDIGILSEIKQTHEVALMYPDAKTKLYAYAASVVNVEIPHVPRVVNVTSDLFHVKGFGEQVEASAVSIPATKVQPIPTQRMTRVQPPALPQTYRVTTRVAPALLSQSVVSTSSNEMIETLLPIDTKGVSGQPESVQVASAESTDTPFDPWTWGLAGIVLVSVVPLLIQRLSPPRVLIPQDDMAAEFKIVESADIRKK